MGVLLDPRVIRPNLGQLPDLPQLARLVEGIGVVGLARLAIDVDELLRIGMVGTLRDLLHDVSQAQRVVVLHCPAIRTVIHGIAIPRTRDHEDLRATHVFPVVLHRTTVEPVEIFQSVVGAEQGVRLHFHRDPTHATQTGNIGPGVVSLTRIVVTQDQERGTGDVERRGEAGVLPELGILSEAFAVVDPVAGGFVLRVVRHQEALVGPREHALEAATTFIELGVLAARSGHDLVLGMFAAATHPDPMHFAHRQAVVLPAEVPVPDHLPTVVLARLELGRVEGAARSVVFQRAVGSDLGGALVLLGGGLVNVGRAQIASVLDRHLHAVEDPFRLEFLRNEGAHQVSFVQGDDVAINELRLRGLVSLEPGQIVLFREGAGRERQGRRSGQHHGL